MLVLRRRMGEALLIGDEIEIEFLEITSQAVKIGINAPRHISILRKELQLTKTQNQAAASTPADLESISRSLENFRK